MSAETEVQLIDEITKIMDMGYTVQDINRACSKILEVSGADYYERITTIKLGGADK